MEDEISQETSAKGMETWAEPEGQQQMLVGVQEEEWEAEDSQLCSTNFAEQHSPTRLT